MIRGREFIGDLAYAKLKRIEIDEERFTHIFAEGRHGSKTVGEVFQYWLSRDQYSLGQYLYVGDNKKQDIDVPNSLGIMTCYVGGNYRGADFCFENVLELESLLK